MSFLMELWTKPYLQWTLLDSLGLYFDIAVVMGIYLYFTKRG